MKHSIKALRLAALAFLLSVSASMLSAQEPEVATSVPQQQTMAEMLRRMPESVLPLLTRNDCLDLLDYAEAGRRAAVRNRLGSESVLEVLTERRALIRMTSLSSVELRRVRLADGTEGVFLLHTFRPDSTSSLSDVGMEVYDAGWKPVEHVLPDELTRSADWTAASFDSADSNALHVRWTRRHLSGRADATDADQLVVSGEAYYDWTDGRLVRR